MSIKKCKYYDDGHGNGSYCSGSHCGPPSCNKTKGYFTPKCSGNLSKCDLKNIKI